MSDMNFDVLAALLASRTMEQFVQALDEQIHRLGFTSWTYAVDVTNPVDPRRERLLGNYDPDWVKHYFLTGYLPVDPTIQHCREQESPFLWPQGRRLRDMSTPVNLLFHEAAEFGLVSGMSIPVRGLGCSWGLLSLAAPHELSQADLMAQVPEAVLLASYAHEAGYRLSQDVPAIPHLTACELECLQWSAEGKSSWEISRLLGISERTAVFHMQNAAHKLGVTARQPAIARAVALGLIKP